MSKEIQRNIEAETTSPNGRGKNFLMIESEFRSSGECVSRRANAFTLAEIMVVLFIMTIILAAFAPLMTVRAKSTSRTSPWNWATPDSANTYFGVHPNQRVMIGQKTMGTDPANKLTIKPATSSQAHIYLKQFDNNGSSSKIHIYSANTVVASRASANAGNSNTALGYSSLTNNSSGISNTALGAETLTSNTTGNYNTAVGDFAGHAITTGVENTLVGHGAYHGLNGSYNTMIGAYSGYRVSGNFNTSIGHYSCYGVTSGTRVTCLGAFSGPNSNDVANNKIYLGNTGSTVYVLGYLNATSSNLSSDIRLKNIQGDYTSGLEQIKKIKPVKFTFKDDKKKTPRVGVIAQDLQKVFPKAVMKGDDGFLKIRQEDMFYAMINAIKELASKLDTIIEKQKSIEKRLEKLENIKTR